MNERELRRLLRRLVLLTSPVPLALVGGACGGTALMSDAPGSAGVPAAGGSGTSAGASGTTAGAFGAGAGASGAGAGASGAGAGASGVGGMRVGESGSGGTAGAAGYSGETLCMASENPMPVPCGAGRQQTLPRACVDSALETVGSTLPSDTCLKLCGLGFRNVCTVAAVDAESVTLNCPSGCVTGRRPLGLCLPLTIDESSLAGYFASLARLEAASVDAFRILRDELRAHGAPKRLVRAAARAARDEIRHARATGALARRFGGRPDVAVVERGAVRALASIALENAVEGCVRETYGALLATWQAGAARDPIVRAVMTRIARDETRHAALSWQVGRWLATRLDRRAKVQVEVARQAAVRELLSSLANDAEPSFAAVVGLPVAAQASRLAREMQRALWS